MKQKKENITTRSNEKTSQDFGRAY